MSVEYEVRQTYWFQGLNRNRSETVTVQSIGRKWVNLSNGHRVAKGSSYADGGEYSSPGRLWKSEDDLNRWTERNLLWRKFKSYIQYQDVPVWINDDQLESMIKLVEGSGDER